MKVKCLKSGGWNEIEFDKIYQSLPHKKDLGENYLYVIFDEENNFGGFFPKEYFQSIEDIRDEKIESILNDSIKECLFKISKRRYINVILLSSYDEDLENKSYSVRLKCKYNNLDGTISFFYQSHYISKEELDIEMMPFIRENKINFLLGNNLEN